MEKNGKEETDLKNSSIKRRNTKITKAVCFWFCCLLFGCRVNQLVFPHDRLASQKSLNPTICFDNSNFSRSKVFCFDNSKSDVSVIYFTKTASLLVALLLMFRNSAYLIKFDWTKDFKLVSTDQQIVKKNCSNWLNSQYVFTAYVSKLHSESSVNPRTSEQSTKLSAGASCLGGASETSKATSCLDERFIRFIRFALRLLSFFF